MSVLGQLILREVMQSSSTRTVVPAAAPEPDLNLAERGQLTDGSRNYQLRRSKIDQLISCFLSALLMIVAMVVLTASTVKVEDWLDVLKKSLNPPECNPGKEFLPCFNSTSKLLVIPE
jgi:hypothetical protein